MGSHRVGHDWSDSAAAAAWNHLQINDDKLVDLCLIHFATELWQAWALPVTLNKGSKFPDLKKFFNIFKTQRDHLVVAKTYLVIPPTFSVSKRDTQADWLGAQETSVLSVQKFLSYLSLQCPGRSRVKAYVCRDYSLKKACHVLGKLCSMLFHLIVTTPYVEGIITHIVLLRKIKAQKGHAAREAVLYSI